MLGRLRDRIRKRFTRIIYESVASTVLESSRHKSARIARRKRSPRARALPPSERFVWGMVALIIALVGAIVLEAIFIVVTGRVSTELVAVITGLIGSFTTAFLLGPKETS